MHAYRIFINTIENVNKLCELTSSYDSNIDIIIKQNPLVINGKDAKAITSLDLSKPEDIIITGLTTEQESEFKKNITDLGIFIREV